MLIALALVIGQGMIALAFLRWARAVKIMAENLLLVHHSNMQVLKQLKSQREG